MIMIAPGGSHAGVKLACQTAWERTGRGRFPAQHVFGRRAWSGSRTDRSSSHHARTLRRCRGKPDHAPLAMPHAAQIGLSDDLFAAKATSIDWDDWQGATAEPSDGSSRGLSAGAPRHSETL